MRARPGALACVLVTQLCMAAIARAQAPAQPSADSSYEQAHAVLARAEALFKAENYDAALGEFSRAYELLEGSKEQVLVLNNLAVCHERMFRYDMALHYYERYLAEGPAEDEADRREVAAAVRTLRGLLATLRIASDVPAEVWVDDRPFGHAPAEVLVPAGRHVIELRARLHETARQEVTIGARQTRRLEFVLPRLSDYRGLAPAYFVSSASIAAALLVTAGVLGVRTLTLSDAGTEHAALAMHMRTPELEREEERVRDWALGTDLVLGGAVLFGATSLLLFFLTEWEQKEAPLALRASVINARAQGATFTLQLP